MAEVRGDGSQPMLAPGRGCVLTSAVEVRGLGLASGHVGTVIDVTDGRCRVDVGGGDVVTIDRAHLAPIDLDGLPQPGEVIRDGAGRIGRVVAVIDQDLHLDLEGEGMCVALRSDPRWSVDRSEAATARADALGLRGGA